MRIIRRFAALRRVCLPLAGIILAILLLGIAPAPHVLASTVNVTTTSDVANHPACVSDGATAPCSLRDAVRYANAHSGTMISIPAGTYNLTQGALNPIVDMMIVGSGASSTIINGDMSDRVLNLTGGNVTITDVTMQNGGGSGGGGGDGGAVNASGSSLTLNSSVISNSAGAHGGGIIVGGSTTFTMNDSTLRDNTSANFGAGLVNNGTAIITRSTISGNQVLAAVSGGGIYNNGTLTLTNSTISGNTSGNQGGGFINLASATLVNSTIANNSSLRASDAFYTSSIVTLQNSILSGSCINSGGSITSLDYNLSSDGTCGLSSTSHDLPNTAPNLGILHDNGGPTLTHLPLTGSAAIDKIPNANAGCPATDQRGTTRPQPTGGTCDIGAVEVATLAAGPAITGITPNRGITSGGQSVVISGTGLLNATSVLFGGNSASVTANTDTRLTVNTPAGSLGAVDVTVATASGSTTQSNGFTYTTPVSAVMVTTNTDTNNTCAGDGTTTPCTLRDAMTYASANAGTAITVPAGTYNLTLGVLNATASMTITGAGAGSTIIDAGGQSQVLAARAGDVVITGVTLRNANTTGDGGGVYAVGNSLTINSSVISSNTAHSGAGIIVGGATMLTVNDSTISGNMATTVGGGIANNGTTNIYRSTISGNQSQGGNGGGGVYNTNIMTLTNSTISTNTSSGQGGGIYTNGSLSLLNSTISNNTAVTASGAFYTEGNVTLRNSILDGSCTDNGAITSQDYNLDADGSCGLGQTHDHANTVPNLGPLADNGGPTFTHALLTGSVAINKIPNSSAGCPATDQRSIARPQPTGGTCDIGAYEYQSTVATTFALAGYPSSSVAGIPGTVTVTAQDSNGATIATYTGTVHFTSSDIHITTGAGLPQDYTFVTGDSGTKTFSVTLRTAGTQSVIVTDIAPGGITGTQSGISVTPATATTLTVTGFPTPQTAGVAGDVTVTAIDGFGNVATGYTGIVTFTSSDSQVNAGTGLPSDYQFVAGNNGVHTFTGGVTLKTAGAATITATDTVTGTIFGKQVGITVNPASLSAFVVSGFPSPSVAGAAHDVTVRAVDGYNNTIPTYTGIVHFTSNDPLATGGAELPSDYPFVTNDGGAHTFVGGVTLKTAGTAQSITVTDTPNNVTGAQANITVNPAGAAILIVAGFSSPQTAGAVGSITVTAKDAFNNTATGYTGTVHFTSNDPQATMGAGLPNDFSFSASNSGAHTFTNLVTLKTAGTAHTIVATDAGTSSITGTQSGITITPAGATTLMVSGFPSPQPAGVAGTVTVTAKDPFSNTATGYAGMVHFVTPNDPQSTIPPDYQFTVGASGDNGVHGLSVLFKTAGAQAITVTDTVTSSITGTQSGITINAGILSSFVLTDFPATTTAGIAHDLTVRAIDANGNTVTGYTGTIRFTSNDPQATAGSGLPVDYQFVAGNNGIHTFNAGGTLKTAGATRMITVTDTGATSATGVQSNIVVNPAGAATFVVTGFTSPRTAGTADTVTVTAKDAFSNVATGYTGTVHFTSNDPLATAGSGLPADYHFLTGTNNDNGTHTFTNLVTLKTAGTSQSITVTDSSVTGSQSGITINAAAATTLIVSGFVSPQTAGAAGSLTVTAKDTFNNTATSYTGTIRFATPSDTKSILPANYTFTTGAGNGNDNGVHVFAGVIFKTAGPQTITATDTTTGSISGTQSGITITAGSFNSLVLTGFPLETFAGAPHDVTVRATDANGNTITTYGGKVQFTSNDPQATTGAGLPNDYTFVANDLGIHIFTNGVTLKTTGTNQSIAVADANSITGTQSGIMVDPGAATQLLVTGFPSPQTAGVAGDVTVTAKDSYGNTATGYIGHVHFTTPNDVQATVPTDYGFTTGATGSKDNGVHVFTSGVTFKTAASQSITGTDTGTSSITGTQSNILINPGPATTLTVTGFTSPQIAGVAGTVTVTARDAFTNLATGYIGVIHFTSNDPLVSAGAGLPADYIFNASDNGVHTFTNLVTLKTVGTTRNIIVTDTPHNLTGTQSPITINPAGATTLVASGFPSPQTAGVAGTIVVTAKDAFNNVVTGYTGSVHFTSDDPLATIGAGLPADYTFLAADNGAHTFSATLKTAGATRSITVTDTAHALTSTQANITVNAAAATTLTVTGLPAVQVAGAAGTITITAKDAFSNSATGYTGTVHFVSSDPLATAGTGLPNDYHFTTGAGTDNGVHVFTNGVTLKTAGARTVTATDSVTASITGVATTTVTPATGTATVTVSGFPSSINAGAAGTVTLTIKDAFNNLATGYTGTVHFTSNDAAALLPPNYTFTTGATGDNGVHTFPNGVTFTVAGTRTITATDMVTSSITGTQAGITVNATFTAITPESGALAGGNAVILSGTGFTGTATVSFGASAATGVTVVNPTTITVTAPAHVAGPVDVKLTIGGATLTLPGAYTYGTVTTIPGVKTPIGPSGGPPANPLPVAPPPGPPASGPVNPIPAPRP